MTITIPDPTLASPPTDFTLLITSTPSVPWLSSHNFNDSPCCPVHFQESLTPVHLSTVSLLLYTFWLSLDDPPFSKLPWSDKLSPFSSVPNLRRHSSFLVYGGRKVHVPHVLQFCCCCFLELFRHSPSHTTPLSVHGPFCSSTSLKSLFVNVNVHSY